MADYIVSWMLFSGKVLVRTAYSGYNIQFHELAGYSTFLLYYNLKVFVVFKGYYLVFLVNIPFLHINSMRLLNWGFRLRLILI